MAANHISVAVGSNYSRGESVICQSVNCRPGSSQGQLEISKVAASYTDGRQQSYIERPVPLHNFFLCEPN